MVVELLVDEDRQFQTVGAAILKALDWIYRFFPVPISSLCASGIKVKVKGKGTYSSVNGTPSHSYGVSLAV